MKVERWKEEEGQDTDVQSIKMKGTGDDGWENEGEIDDFEKVRKKVECVWV